MSFGEGEPITPDEYAGNGEQRLLMFARIALDESMIAGDVQEFRYAYALRDSFNSRSISGLQNLDNRGWIASSGANVFVANHDTERSLTSLKYDSPNNAYTLAHVFSLAHPYGTPVGHNDKYLYSSFLIFEETVLSSYGFSDITQGAPNGSRSLIYLTFS
jgi:hypothetical protein